MTLALKSVRKSAILLALYYSLVAVGIIVFGSPLFRVLSFEYSSLVALFGSLPVMWFAARYCQAHASEPILDILVRVWLAVVPGIIMPILISLALVESCDFGYGLVYYAHIVLPSTMTATLFGALCALIAPRKRIRTVIIVWVLTFIISLIPGYTSSQINCYGWQYGYFPGFVWDDYIELGFHYNLAVFGYMFIAALLIFGFLTKDERKHYKETKKKQPIRFWILYVIFSLLTVESILHGYTFFGWLGHSNVEGKLDASIHVGNITIHHERSIKNEEKTLLQHEIHRYLHEIDSIYPGIDTTMEIDVYIYSTSDDMQRYVGTRRASIAKPWLGTLHIAKENLSSLKHELVHVLLEPHGNFPTGASWSTGLTEGAAVAVEDEYDGIRTVDDLSRWALAMKYATGVSPFMQFTGFASTAPTTSYIFAGSFSRYLIAAHGHAKYLDLYHTREYERIYGTTLGALDTAWQSHIHADAPLTPEDSLLARYYFERKSVVHQPCLRRIGRLVHKANEAYKEKDYPSAFTYYEQAYSEDSSRTDAFRGMVLAKVKQKQFSEAMAIFDRDPIMTKPNGRVALATLCGDVTYLATTDSARAAVYYRDGVRHAPNDTRFISAVSILAIMKDSLFDLRDYLSFRYGLDTSIYGGVPQALYAHAWEVPMGETVRTGYVLLRTLHNESRGEYSAAIHEWNALGAFVDPQTLPADMRKAYDLTERKVRRWAEALSAH